MFVNIIHVALALLLIRGAQTQQQQSEDSLCKYSNLCASAIEVSLNNIMLHALGNQNCINREEFEPQQKETNSVQRELNYGQNTTINILKN